ncbi:MAG: Ig-like domain-containing protein, partial [Chitinophagaceae bacterium]|nr:Ig-like domain-containing protein [Chitinophagaceae bacterium]
MQKIIYSRIYVLLAILLLASCANIVPPSGGKVDKKAPKLLSIKPSDSLLNTRVTKIEMRFDEFVTINDAAKEVKVSPILAQNPTLSVSGKTVTLKIADSLLAANTTYSISLG